MGKEIRIGLELATTATTSSPVVTDMMWQYVLDFPTSEERKKQFDFAIDAPRQIELRDERGETETNDERVSGIWTTLRKKQLLNFVGVDNDPSDALSISYTGTAGSCLLTTDRTNQLLTTSVPGATAHQILFLIKTGPLAI